MDDLGVSLGCLFVPLSLGDVPSACFSGVTSYQTQDVSKPLVRGLGITLLQSYHFQELTGARWQGYPASFQGVFQTCRCAAQILELRTHPY